MFTDDTFGETNDMGTLAGAGGDQVRQAARLDDVERSSRLAGRHDQDQGPVVAGLPGGLPRLAVGLLKPVGSQGGDLDTAAQLLPGGGGDQDWGITGGRHRRPH